MAQSPFAFLRGSAAVMARDLAATPAPGSRCRRAATAPVELRRLRDARAQRAVRHQRLRRDLPGALGVGREAARGERRGGGARDRLGGQRAAPMRRARRRRLPGQLAEYARRAPSRSGTRASTSRCWRGSRQDARPGKKRAGEAEHRAARTTTCRAPGRTDRRGRPGPADRRRSRHCSCPGRTPSSVRPRSRRSTATCRRPSAPDRARSLLDRYRFVDVALKVVGVGSVGTRCCVIAAAWRRRRRPALPPGQGGRGLGARAARSGARQSGTHGQRVVSGQRADRRPRATSSSAGCEPATAATSTSASCAT